MAKQSVTITRTRTRVSSKLPNVSSGKKGNSKRCPTCGRYLKRG